jgi:LasA protease
MRKLATCVLFLALSVIACARSQPDIIVITATFPPAVSPPFQPTRVQAGTLIQPTPNPTLPLASTTARQDYVVQPGDTLYGIAATSGVSMDTLIALNNLTDPNNLIVGQVIHLPDPASDQGSDFKILPDSRLVRGPGSSVFDSGAFINTQLGYLRDATDTVNDVTLTGAQVVKRVSLEYSVDARLLLALLEYKSRYLSNPTPSDDQKTYALGAPASDQGFDRNGLYRQLAWAADQLNKGYYGWKEHLITQMEFTDKTRLLFARDLNPGTVGVQWMLSQYTDYPTWQQAVSADGLYRTYISYFGDPFAGAVDPLIPADLQPPQLTFPFPSGQTWYFTGGPHGGWGTGSAWAAIDFAPPDDLTTKTTGCYISDNFGTAVAPGVIARTAEGTVILDLDGDGDESTGWTILYLHMASLDRVQAGTVVQTGDRIGRPSCEGGVSNGTHMHIARRYNGEWIPVSCDDCGEPQLVLDGWYVYGLSGQEYQGYMLKGRERRTADQGRNNTDNQVSR